MNSSGMLRTAGAALFAILFLTGTTLGQFGGPSTPKLRGVWNPVVGHGAVYEMETPGEGKRQMEMAIVGTETVRGATGHWMEISMRDPQHGEMVIKSLFVARGDNLETVRMIMQAAGQPPMEMPAQMRGRMGMSTEEPEKDFRADAERVGTETITTPAGTFQCEHFRSRDGRTEIWFSEKVVPYGLVRMKSADGTTMTLLRVLTDAKTKIRGTPMRMDQMMPQPR